MPIGPRVQRLAVAAAPDYLERFEPPNRIPAEIHDQIIEMALEQTEMSPRELAVRFTDEKRYFVSEASVYRLLKGFVA